MSTEANKAIIRRFFEEAWNKGNLAVVDETISPDAKAYGPLASVPFTPDFVKQLITEWRTGFPDYQYIIEDLFALDDLVIAHVPFTGTHTGMFKYGTLSLPPTGGHIQVREIIIHRMAEGKVVELWAAYDRLGLLEPLGAVSVNTPAPATS